MKVLVQGYWTQNSNIVIYACLVPWLLYLVCTMLLFARILAPEDAIDHSENSAMKYILSVLNIILIGY